MARFYVDSREYYPFPELIPETEAGEYVRDHRLLIEVDDALLARFNAAVAEIDALTELLWDRMVDVRDAAIAELRKKEEH